MRRYAYRLGSVCAGASVFTWIVIQTDEVAHHEVLARGFVAIPDDLSDDEAVELYGALSIVLVTNASLGDVVQ